MFLKDFITFYFVNFLLSDIDKQKSGPTCTYLERFMGLQVLLLRSKSPQCNQNEIQFLIVHRGTLITQLQLYTAKSQY